MHSGKSPRPSFGQSQQADLSNTRNLMWSHTVFALFPALRCTVEWDYTVHCFTNTPLIICTYWLSLPRHHQCMNMQTHKVPTYDYKALASKLTHKDAHARAHTNTHEHTAWQTVKKSVRSHRLKLLLTPTLAKLNSWWMLNLKWSEWWEGLCILTLCVCTVGACKCTDL